MISIDIKNRLFTLFAKVVNIFDFDSKGLFIREYGKKFKKLLMKWMNLVIIIKTMM